MTDFSNGAKGFHLEYEIQGCGGILRKPFGEFSSPGYPHSYETNLNCTWQIIGEYGHLIEVNVTDYDFEATTDCKQDGIVVSIPL